MDAKIKRKAIGRIFTITSKMEELQQLGYEDSDLNSTLPHDFDGWIQEMMNIYSTMYAGG
jgi:hypothetical protein